jgi:hypothetical protein
MEEERIAVPSGECAVLDGAVDAAGGMRSDLDRVRDRELDLPGRIPLIAVCAAQRAPECADALETQEDAWGGRGRKAPAAQDQIAVLDAACERDLA